MNAPGWPAGSPVGADGFGAPVRGLRVMVVDDHDLFRTGMRALLEEEGFEVTDANSGQAALRRTRGFMPDVVVMDVNMPRMSGIEATREILGISPSTAVLMLTVAHDDARVVDAVVAGASGYLLKDASLAEIVAGIRSAAAGESVLASRVAGGLLEKVRSIEQRRGGPDARRSCPLSERELQVLSLLAAGCDNSEISRRLFVSASTVKTHVSAILDKLGVGNRVQAAVYAIRHGLVDPPA